MSGIPEATPVILTMEERADLDRLARSTRTEHRLRQRARIVLLAADGMASRAIGRAVGCTTGTVSKWRVRYAEKREPKEVGPFDPAGLPGVGPLFGRRVLWRALTRARETPYEDCFLCQNAVPRRRSELGHIMRFCNDEST
jgi:hypothetical protein